MTDKMKTHEWDKWLPGYKGNRPTLNEDQVNSMLELRKEGKSAREISEMFFISPSSVIRYTNSESRMKDRAQSKKYRKKYFVPGKRKRTPEQKARLKVTDEEYKQTERGFFICLYNSMQSSLRAKEKLIKYHEKVPPITIDQLMSLWNKHLNKFGMVCFYTGLPLTFYNPKKKRAKTLVTIDRFDSSLGYTEENIVFCCWSFNDRKNVVDIKMAKIIIEKRKEWLAIIKNNPIKINSVAPSGVYGKEDRAFRKRIREQDPIKYKKLNSMYSGMRRRNKKWCKAKDKRYNPDLISFSGLVGFIEGYIERYGLNCFYTGEPIDFKIGTQKKKNRNAISIDRIDSNKSYTLDNMLICSFGFNVDKKGILIQDCHIIIKKELEREINFSQGRRIHYSQGGRVG